MKNLSDFTNSINPNTTLILILLNAVFGLCALIMICSISGIILYNNFPIKQNNKIFVIGKSITPIESTSTLFPISTNLPITRPSNTISAYELISTTQTKIIPAKIEVKQTEIISPITIQIPPAEGAPCLPQNTTRQLGMLTSIIDGDTINVQIDGQPFTVSYIGIDTPEIGQTYGVESSNANSRIINNQPIILIKDQSETDQNDRLLRYVIVNDDFVNYELIKQGFASAKDYPPDSSCATTFSRAEQSARYEEIGLWVVFNLPPISTPRISALPTSTPKISGPNSNCDPAYPDACIPPPPPDLNCEQISYTNFTVLPPDPHGFDGDNDGRGCEEP